jgi:hypothetical protein
MVQEHSGDDPSLTAIKRYGTEWLRANWKSVRDAVNKWRARRTKSTDAGLAETTAA